MLMLQKGCCQTSAPLLGCQSRTHGQILNWSKHKASCRCLPWQPTPAGPGQLSSHGQFVSVPVAFKHALYHVQSSCDCRKLTESLKPAKLTVRDDSSKHAGHSGNPSGNPDAETHFRQANGDLLLTKITSLLEL